MSAKNWNWVNDKALMNEIINLDNKLSNYELTLYWCTSEVSETTFALTIVSKIDSSIVIRDSGFIHTHLLLWSDKLKARLQLISERVEFIAFVHDSILKLKKSDERLSFGELRFVRHYDSDYGDVDFDFKNGLKLVGGGHFHYNQDENGVGISVGNHTLVIECPSLLDITDSPHDLSLEINVHNNDGFIESTVNGTLRKTYGSLTTSNKLALVEDFNEMMNYLNKLK